MNCRVEAKTNLRKMLQRKNKLLSGDETSQKEQRMLYDTTERLHFDFSLSCIGEGNGNPL